MSQKIKNRMANSVDPDEMAYNEPSHLDLHSKSMSRSAMLKWLKICCLTSLKYIIVTIALGGIGIGVIGISVNNVKSVHLVLFL